MHVEKTYLKASFIFFQIKSLFNNLYMLLEWLHFCSPLFCGSLNCITFKQQTVFVSVFVFN